MYRYLRSLGAPLVRQGITLCHTVPLPVNPATVCMVETAYGRPVNVRTSSGTVLLDGHDRRKESFFVLFGTTEHLVVEHYWYKVSIPSFEKVSEYNVSIGSHSTHFSNRGYLLKIIADVYNNEAIPFERKRKKARLEKTAKRRGFSSYEEMLTSDNVKFSEEQAAKVLKKQVDYVFKLADQIKTYQDRLNVLSEKKKIASPILLKRMTAATNAICKLNDTLRAEISPAPTRKKV